ncbi:MAG TPA: hypothetical protein VFV87_12525, partial [Pirellulaceae bacterium]|nr:hypothetical protein [Pirellulaceae bacterium]
MPAASIWNQGAGRMALTFVVAVMLLAADEPSPDAAVEKSRQEQVSVLAPAQARSLKMLSGEDRSTEAKLHSEPLLR